ncbi:MAG: cytochrome c [Flavobacteriaceae bacterium]|nr:cytochrome c [Flavobacteriaceae bacterium]
MKSKYSLILLTYFFIACNSSEKKNIAIYLNESEAISTQDPLKESIDRGEIIYSDFCVQCHMANGLGVPATFPPLAKSNWLIEKRTESIHAVKFGQNGKIKVNGKSYNNTMAPMGLTNQEVADVLNYVMNSWGNTQKEMVTEEEVSKVLKE